MNRVTCRLAAVIFALLLVSPVAHSAEPARAQKYMAATANPLATETALEILRRGGSAVDAAIAAQMVLTLVEPQSSGLGGGAFMLHFDSETGRIVTYDGRETAPASARPDMFLGADGEPMKWMDAVVGGRSVGVPGLLRMLELAHDDHGILTWSELFADAIRLAEEGFPVSARLNGLIKADKQLRVFPDTEGYFFGPDGEPHPVGTVLHNTPLANTLAIIADGGADSFYTGPIARDIADTVSNAPLNPASMTPSDIARYRAIKRDAVCGPYRGFTVCGMPPPSSGGITTLQILGILERFDMSGGADDLATAHLLAEASRLAFADRNQYIADPNVVPQPAGLLDAAYLAERAALIDPAKSMGRAKAGKPENETMLRFAPSGDEQGVSTTHLVIVDGAGDVVSLTSSIETQFGSRLMVRGFLLNNQLTDFSFVADKKGVPIANRVEAGKRPRSSMAPTIMLNGDGSFRLAVGSPGGSSIIGYVTKTLVAYIDWGMNIQDAIEVPHIVNRNARTRLEKDTAAEALAPGLEALGHTVNITRMTSGLQGISREDGVLLGGADPRREGVALGD
ncbi:MAG: gamma-glutamyltransferase [Rhodospirillales bacterium]